MAGLDRERVAPAPAEAGFETTTDEARPQHESTLKWSLAPSYAESAFTFDPPEGAHKIVFATVNADAKN